MRFTKEPKLESCLKSVEKQSHASVRITKQLPCGRFKYFKPDAMTPCLTTEVLPIS